MTSPETVHTPDEQGHRIPLSSNQQFFSLFDKGPEQGALGPRHLVVAGWRLGGEIDVDAIRGALDDLVARHEALRTTIVRDEGDEYQKIHPPCSPELTIRDLTGSEPRDLQAERLVAEIEAGRISVEEIPLLKAALGRFGDDDAVLVFAAHHIASDGWSMNLLINDFAHLYAARRGHATDDLPDVKQYRHYAEWQQANADDFNAGLSREYWQNKLAGARLLPLPTDRPLTDDVGVYGVHRFEIDKETTEAALAFARVTRSSPFMVLFSVFNLLLNKRTGVTDILVPTITSGRAEPQFEDTVGVFFNFIPVRTDLAGCGNFREVVDRVRTACLEAYSYEIPFLHIVGQGPEITNSLATGHHALFALQAFQFPPGMDGGSAGGMTITEIRKRLLSDSDTSDIPDGALWTLDIQPSGETIGSLRFNGKLFDESTIVAIVGEYDRLLRNAIAAPDSPLDQL